MRKAREAAKAQTRGRLIEAARRAFLADGFHGASLVRIAGDAGYTVGALYSNFAGKDELFLAVFEEYVAERAKELEALLESRPGKGGRAAMVADQWMRKLTEEPAWFPLVTEFAGHAARNPELRVRFAASFGALRLTGARMIEGRAVNGGMGPDDLATVIKALGNGLALERMIEPAAVPDDLFARATTALLAGAARRPARRG
jgi:AcrR family transcriptional regulator